MYKTINTDMIFSDTTENFLSKMEPEKFDLINIYIRTATEEGLEVFLIFDGFEFLMNPIESTYYTNIFQYYEYTIRLEDKLFSYCFKIVKGKEYCYYNRLGVVENDDPIYRFEINPGFKTPDWAKGIVMYQIFPDRFYNGDKTNDVLSNEYYYLNHYSEKVEDWNGDVENFDVNRFYGGDLQGIIKKLDYLSKLGIEAIYLNPIFVSPSSHKYDTQDYDFVDPHLGVIKDDIDGILEEGIISNTFAKKYVNRIANRINLVASNELFSELVDQAHLRGIRVILDGVFNHCGSFNKWMDGEKIYESFSGYPAGAFTKEESPYKDYFKFFSKKWPDNTEYDGWWGHKTLPKLNYENSKQLQDYILETARKWLSPPYNIDGWRLDVAADLGYSLDFNHDFWRRFRKVVKETKPDALIIAEHYGNPADWLHGDQWDTIMNYDAFMEPVSWFLTGMEKHSDANNPELLGNAGHFFSAMKHHMGNMRTPSILTSMNQLSNHDHSRFLTRTNGVVGRINTKGAKAANENVKKSVFKEAVVIQMTWPGAPTLYYGDEASLCGWTDPDNRRTYPWGNEDFDMIEFHRDIILLHKSSKALKFGSLITLYEDFNIISYARCYKEEIIIVVINNNNRITFAEIPLTKLGVNEHDEIYRIFLTSDFTYNVGKLRTLLRKDSLPLELEEHTAAIYQIHKKKV